MAHTHPLFPIQCRKAQFIRTPCELAFLYGLQTTLDGWEREGDSNKVFASQQYGNDCMLAINRFIVIFDFREAKISREFLASEAIKRTLYMEEEVIIIA